jgi:hypothetical protein
VLLAVLFFGARLKRPRQNAKAFASSLLLAAPSPQHKMSKSIHKHQQHRATAKTRGGVLPELVKATLLLDIVTNPDFSCDKICNLSDREYNNYEISSIRNRFHYLTRKKTRDPKEFWRLYSEANKFALSAPYRDTVEEESDDEEPPSTPPATPPAQSSRRQRTPDTSTIPSTPPPPASSLNSKNKKTMSGSARKKYPPSASSTFAYKTMFESLDEAEANGT